MLYQLSKTKLCGTRLLAKVCPFARLYGGDGGRSAKPVSALPTLRLNNQKTGATMTVPGLGLLDTDRAGYMSIWNAARIGESGRFTFYTQHPYDQFLGQKRLIFLLTGHCQFHPAYYTRSHYYNPIDIDTQLVNIGRTSYAHRDRCLSHLTGDLLWTALLQLVTVGKETRRPIALPEEVKRLFEGKDTSFKSERIISQDRPSTTHTVEFQTLWSDADYYVHTNHSSYIKYCHDAASILCKKGVFKRLRGDLAFQRIKECQCIYLGETVPEQSITVYVWEEINGDPSLNFDIECEGISVFQCTFLFYKPTGQANVDNIQLPTINTY